MKERGSFFHPCKTPLKSMVATLLFFLTFPSLGADPPPVIHPFQPGDQAFMERANKDRAFEALKLFRGYHEKEPDNPETAYRVAMACYFIGIRLTTDPKNKEKLFAEGRDAAKKAAKKNPDCHQCHFWSAINIALYGETVGVVKMLFSLKQVMKHLEKSIKLDPTYMFGGAYRLLGVIREKLPGILGGSNSKAKNYYEKAIESAPDEPLNYLFLARLTQREFENPGKAMEIAARGLKIKSLPQYRLESIDALEDLKRFAAKTQVEMEKFQKKP